MAIGVLHVHNRLEFLAVLLLGRQVLLNEFEVVGLNSHTHGQCPLDPKLQGLGILSRGLLLLLTLASRLLRLGRSLLLFRELLGLRLQKYRGLAPVRSHLCCSLAVLGCRSWLRSTHDEHLNHNAVVLSRSLDERIDALVVCLLDVCLCLEQEARHVDALRVALVGPPRRLPHHDQERRLPRLTLDIGRCLGLEQRLHGEKLSTQGGVRRRRQEAEMERGVAIEVLLVDPTHCLLHVGQQQLIDLLEVVRHHLIQNLLLHVPLRTFGLLRLRRGL
mmetsp:Transcript_120664/g.257732  ORF Transcript_120664/g.257732 Transcript_120664/m.257732 type:complete len:275 (-) Transcript_120664:761-1585(-)